jgi:hypothetical protein
MYRCVENFTVFNVVSQVGLLNNSSKRCFWAAGQVDMGLVEIEAATSLASFFGATFLGAALLDAAFLAGLVMVQGRPKYPRPIVALSNSNMGASVLSIPSAARTVARTARSDQTTFLLVSKVFQL